MPSAPASPPLEEPSAADTRSRILSAAAELIAAGGSDAATTRAVAAAASVQAPTIYRLFGDKGGLLDAVAEQALADYVADKVLQVVDDDPVAALRQGWDAHIAFGLAHPAIFALMHAARPGPPSAASAAGLAILRDKLRRVARAGRLRVSEEQAVDLMHAMGTGTVLTLLRKPPEERQGLSEAARESVLSTLVGAPPAPADTGAPGLASALRACLDEIAVLTPGEQHLLEELLERIGRAR